MVLSPTTVLAPHKSIWYKNCFGEWRRSNLSPTLTNLRKVKKELALNGQAGIFQK
jgi:hypothetical protein